MPQNGGQKTNKRPCSVKVESASNRKYVIFKVCDFEAMDARIMVRTALIELNGSILMGSNSKRVFERSY